LNLTWTKNQRSSMHTPSRRTYLQLCVKEWSQKMPLAFSPWVLSNAGCSALLELST